MENDQQGRRERGQKSNAEIAAEAMENLARNAPPGGYLPAIKKRYFKPKTNWAMLSVLIALCGVTIAAISHIT